MKDFKKDLIEFALDGCRAAIYLFVALVIGCCTLLLFSLLVVVYISILGLFVSIK